MTHTYETICGTRVRSSRVEDGIEICNTCARVADKPFRYENAHGKTRGCIATCHDVYVRLNTKPSWMKPHYVLPKWITDARHAMNKLSQRRRK